MRTSRHEKRGPFSSLCLAALVASAACTPTTTTTTTSAPLPPAPPNACPLPWPENTTFLMSGQASITLKSEMSNAFRLQRVVLGLDGALLCARTTDLGEPSLDANATPEFSGSLREGDHEIKVIAVLSGHGTGVFSYLKGYRFNVASSHKFRVERGKRVEVAVIVHEKGGTTTPLEERPAVRYDEQQGVVRILRVPIAAPPTPPPSLPPDLPPPPPPPPP